MTFFVDKNIPAPVIQEPIGYPPGLLGEIARFIYATSPRPSREIAIAGAIGLMAGITGKAYNISGSGLNQYVLLLALTGTGKEAMASGIEKLVREIQKQAPCIENFIGPAEIASGPALLKYIAKNSTSFVSIVGEFGLKLQQLSSPRASSSELTFKRALLDLYNKSGKDKMLRSTIYSDNQKNTENVEAPAFTLLGESTPDTFYAALDQNLIADGLLPRFLIIEYRGKRPKLNKTHSDIEVPGELIIRLGELAVICSRIMHSGHIIDVDEEQEATEFLDRIEDETTNAINETDEDIIKHLWNRAHIKTLKLAALVAVGSNAYHPKISLEHAKWAYSIVERDVQNIMARFEKGAFGKSSEETKQVLELKRLMKEYLTKDYSFFKAYAPETMHKHKVIPYGYIHKRAATLATFRHDRMGATAAIKRTIATILESGDMLQLPPQQINHEFQTTTKCYVIPHPDNVRDV